MLAWSTEAMNLLCPCLCFSESGTVNIMEGNMTVVQDQQVEFQCVTSAWFPKPTVSWTRNGHAVNSSLYNTTSMDDGDYFNSTSVLKFQAVSNTTVQCHATVLTLINPQSSSVFLVVGKEVFHSFILPLCLAPRLLPASAPLCSSKLERANISVAHLVAH